MGASRFIASRLSEGDSRLSRTSNTIAWVSVCLSVAVMIIAIAVVDLEGFEKYNLPDIDARIQDSQ